MLGLTVPTGAAWAHHAVRHLPELLSDHAHCELKAATSALSLVGSNAWNPRVVMELTLLAEEELRHFRAVLALMAGRKIPLVKPPVDVYASRLRSATSAIARPKGITPLTDRLVVGALIEARSCERFKLLLDALDPAHHADVLALYTDLFPAEARHHTLFLDLARSESGASDADAVEARLVALAQEEGRIVIELAKGGERAVIHG